MKRLFTKGLSLFLALVMLAAVLPLNALAVSMADSEDAAVRAETPLASGAEDTAARSASSASAAIGESSGDRETLPADGEEDEEEDPAELLWTNVQLNAVLASSSDGTVTITGTLSGNSTDAGLENSAVVLAPGWDGVASLQEAVTNQKGITSSTSAAELSNILPTLLGVDASFLYIKDTSTESFSSGVWTHTATLGSYGSYADYVSAAQSVGASITESTGIPMQIMLISQGGDSADVAVATVTISDPQYAQAELAVAKADNITDPFPTIVLSSTAKSFSFTLQHTENSQAAATIQSVKWEGNNTDYIDSIVSSTDSSSLTSVALAKGDTQGVTVTLKMSSAEHNTYGRDAWLGDVVIAYNDENNDVERTLRVHVVPESGLGVQPIYVTVTAGGPAVSAGPTYSDSELKYVFVSEDESECGDNYLDYAPATNGSAAAADANDSDGITLELKTGYGVTSLLQVFSKYDDEENFDWVRDDEEAIVLATGFTWPTDGPGDVVTVEAADGVTPGVYTAGTVTVAYVDEEATRGYVSIPVIVTVNAADVYSAIFYANGGSWVVDGVTTFTQTVTSNLPSQEAAKPDNPTRAGYNFLGWSTSATSSIATETTFTTSDNTTTPNRYYAVWQKEAAATFTVSYANADTSIYPSITTLPTDSAAYEAAATVTVLAGEGLSVGDEQDATTGKVYKFTGWTYDGTLYTPNGTLTMPAVNVTLTATWEEVTYTVKYDGNGETMTNASDFADEAGLSNGATTTRASGTPTATGKTFTGWNTRSDGTGTAVTSGSQYTVLKADATDHVITLYAQWSTDQYTVTYNKGSHGGNDVPAAVTANYGTTVTLSGTMATSTESNIHWTFQGWSTTQDDATTTVTEIADLAANTTVYALWAKDTHTVTYDANGGTTTSVPETANNIECGTAYTISSTEPTYDSNHRFLGWDTNAAATTPTYTSAGTTQLTVTGDVTLYAIWETVVTVTWNPNGGTWSDNTTDNKTQTGKTGDAMTTYTASDITKDGYTLTSWDPTPGTTLPSTDTTYTAQWTAEQFTLTYNLNGHGTSDMQPAQETYGYNTSVTPGSDKLVVNTTKDTDNSGIHWVFQGWYQDSDCTTEATTFTITQNTTVYAKWAKDTHTVTYNYNATDGGALDTTAHATGTVTCGESYTISDTEPTRTGYVFVNWSTAATGEGTTYAKGATISTITEDITLYARWRAATYTVKLNYNYKTTTPNSLTKEVNVGTDYILPTLTPETGYTFGGWYNDANLTNKYDGTTVSGANRTNNEVVTLYAKWTPNTYKVNYYVNGPTGGTIDLDENTEGNQSSESFTYGGANLTAQAGSIITGETTGWQFVAWNTAANGTGTAYAASAELPTSTTAADIDLYAQWQVQVSFDLNSGEGGYSDLTGTDLAAPTAQWKDYNSTMTAADLKAITPTGTASNYAFAGWSTTAGTNQTVVTGEQTFTAPVTYYAQWTEKGGDAKVTINLDGAARTSGITSVTVNGTALPWDSTNSVWQTTSGVIPAGTYTVVVDGTDTQVEITVPKGGVGEATVDYYTVTATPGTGAATATASASIVLKGTTGVTLGGTADTYYDVSKPTWTKTSGADFAEGSTTSTLNATLAAIEGTTVYTLTFAKLQATMTYDKGVLPETVEGFTAPDTETVDQGADAYTVKAPTATPAESTGWKFNNWKEGETSYVGGTDTVSPVAGNHTFTAQWQVKVTLDPNTTGTDITGLTATENFVDYGSAYTPTSLGDQTHYTFAGWYDAAAGGTQVTTINSIDAPTTLYAQWTAAKYTVQFVDNNDANDDPAAQTADYNGAITLPSAGTKTGYTFEGWYDKDENVAGAVKVTVDESGKYTVVGDATLYGHWSPASVQIVYTSAVGQAPTETDQTYGTSYPIKGGETVSAVENASGGWNEGNTVFTDENGARWRFDGWTINGAAATSPVTLTTEDNGVVYDETTGYTLTLTASWTRLYTVTYNSNGHGTVEASDFVDKPEGTHTVLSGSEAIPAGENESWSTLYFTDASGNHWKFTGWKDDNGEAHSAEDTITVNRDVTLTAQWDQYYKVTLGAPVLEDDATTTITGGATANFGSDQVYSDNPLYNSAWVQKDVGVSITALALQSSADSYIFAKWTVSENGGSFTSSSDGTSTSAADTFTPAADATLTPSYWKKPTLSPASDWYHLNFNTGETINKGTEKNGATNELPVYTWTQNSASLDTEQIQIEIDGEWKTLTTEGADADVTVNTDNDAGTVTFTFTDAYLKKNLTVPLGQTSATYTIQVNSHTPNNATTNGESTALTATLTVYVVPEALERVDIQVKDGSSATVKVDDNTRDGVQYASHTPTGIERENLLTYTWYYGPTAAEQNYYHTDATSNETNVTNATNNLPTDKNLLSELTGATIDGESATVSNLSALKGQYLYAVVVASGTGYGAVITNSIAVDYDAVVKITKDDAADATGSYTVYLVPQAADNAATYSAADIAALTGVVTTTHMENTNQYATEASALTGGVTYDIYVNRVEGDATLFVKTGESVSTQTDADAAPELKFYSVNAVETVVKDAKDASGANVGESFGENGADKPGVYFYAEGVTTKFDSGTGVYTGTAVTAKAAKTWTQDYHADWGSATSATEPASLTYGTENQTAAEAANTGRSYASITAKTWIGARLAQNLYTVTGNVKGSDNNGKVATATLTYKNEANSTTYTFAGTFQSGGGTGDTVTFTVPKSGVTGAIAGNYTLSATGSDDPRTTILGYCKPTGDAATNTEPIEIAEVTQDADGQFTIFIAASSWTLALTDDRKENAAANGTDASTTVSRTHASAVTAAENVLSGSYDTTWTKTFANYNETDDQLTYQVTVSNPGNTDLKVALTVTKTANGTTTTVYNDATTPEDGKDTNGVAFSDLATGFTLARKGETEDSKTFTVTIPADLDNDDDVTYSFAFTSVDASDPTIYGPSLTYNLALVVEPVAVSTVTIEAGETAGTFTMDTVSFNPENTPLDSTDDDTPTLTTENDLTFQWYVGDTSPVDANGNVTGTKATGEGNDTATYTPTVADGGQTLWLVVTGQNNASGYAVASVTAPYSAAVTIKENDAATTDAGSYTVYLVPNTVDSPDFTEENLSTQGIVQATHEDGAENGVFTTGAVLKPDTTYNVWTNVVKGDTSKYQNSGALGAVSGGVAAKTVTYYSVTVNETTYDNVYAGLVGTAFFGTTGDDGATAAAQTGDTTFTATAKAGTIDVTSGGWVLSGTEVTFTHAAWTKDYTLSWTNATEDTAASAENGGTATATINANTTVEAKLTLNLYDVTAYVIGKGEATYLTLAVTGGNTFTTKSDTPEDAILAAASSLDQISATTSGAPVVLKVPNGSYTATAFVAEGTTLSGYHATHNDSALSEAPVTVTVNSAAADFDVLLNSTGIGLAVTDDDTGDGVTPHEAKVIWEKGDAKSASVTHTETLDYGYSSTKTITLTLSNDSSDTETAGVKQTVYHIVGTGGDATGSAESKVTWSSEQLSSDGTTNTIASLGNEDTATVTLTIPTGLTAGSYTYNAVFTFAGAQDGDTVGTVTYVLQIEVAPAQFSTVTMQYDGDNDAITDSVLQAGKALALHSAETKENDVFSSLTFDETTKDYHYAWYAGASDTASVSWNAGTITVTGADAIIDTADTALSADAIKNYQGQYIYLAIYATADNGKVTGAALSSPVRAGYQGVVQIEEDGALQETEPKVGETAKYTVTIMDGSTEIPTVWDETAKGYVAADNGSAIYLDPAKTYTVMTSAYQGDATTAELTGASITNDNRTATAEYFTVTALPTTAAHYVDAVGEQFDANMPTAVLSVGSATLTSGNTVRKGQSVTAKFASAWTQDYTLTWQEQKGNSAVGTALVDTSLTDTAATAVSTGQTWANISAKTYIGGRLDQNVYKVTGSISGTGAVSAAVMTDGKNNANTTETGGTINKNNSNAITDASNNGTTGDNGDTITLYVVNGTYSLQITPAAGATVRGIAWNGGSFEAGASVSGKDVSADATFTVYLDSATSALRVQDTHTTPAAHFADSTSADASNYRHADHSHEVYFSAMTEDETLTVELENRGNTALTLETPTVWKVTEGASLTNVTWSDWANAAVETLAWSDAGIYEQTNVIKIENKLTDDNKTLAAATAKEDGTLDENSFQKVAAATVTVSKNAGVADSGVYILRYTTEEGPVVYYVVTLTVKPLTITSVSADTPTTAPGAGDTVQLKDYDANDESKTGFENVLVDDDVTDSTDAVAANTVTEPALTDGADVKYQWVKAASALTAEQVKAELSVSAGGVTSNSAAVSVLSGNGADTKQYTVQSGDVDSYLYLVAYAPADAAVNTAGFAVSEAIRTKTTTGIKVSLDGTVRPVSEMDDPGYTIYLLESGKTWTDPTAEGVWATTWNGATKSYQAAIDPEKTYQVYAPTYQGSSTYVNTGLTVGNNATETPVVPYFSVTSAANVTVQNTYDGFAAYLPDSTGEGKSGNAIQNALTVAVSTTKGGTDYQDTLSAGSVPVLADMNVKVTVNAAASSANAAEGAKKSWSEVPALHTLSTSGWKSGTADSGAGVTETGIAYPTADGSGSYLIASGNITVTAANTFSATLAQTLFDVTFKVVDNTPSGTDTENFTPGVASATLTDTETGAGTAWNATTIDPAGGANDATVTFTGVPVGSFAIAAAGMPRTNVEGYTWNDVNTLSTDGKIVTVTTDDAKNKNDDNTIRIQYSSSSVKWMDNFVTSTGAADAENFYESAGFQKVNTSTTGPWLALKEGYSAESDTLTYTVRVVNNGAITLNDFRITKNNDNLTADLNAVKVFDGATGEQKTGADATANVTTTGFNLAVDDWVEFSVTIPEDQAASGSSYTSQFTVSSSNQGKIAGGSYDPAYQVRPVLEFTPGSAKVFYGGIAFEGTSTDVGVKNWDASYGDKPNFTYAILTEEELTAYLNGAARPANAYTEMPAWLTLDADTGAVSFTAGQRATGVNVQTKTANSFADYTADEVTDEVILYVKVTDAANNETYYTTYTVNVEPGTLTIVDGSFAPTTPYYTGDSVDMSAFTYTKVTDQAGGDVVPAAESGSHTAAESIEAVSWSVSPAQYEGTQYSFTVTYNGSADEEKWNYKPATETETITAPQARPLGLTFSDTLGKSSIESGSAALTIGRAPDGGYSAIATDNAPYAPTAMSATSATYRKGEHIVYLDTEPRYTVTLTATGDLTDVKVTQALSGFKVVEGDLSFTTLADGATKTFALELSPVSENTYVGEHTAKFTVTGTGASDQTTSATYELAFRVDAKTITQAAVTGLTDPEPGKTPDATVTVTAQDGGGVAVGDTDKHGNTPIAATVTWSDPEGSQMDPADLFEDGKDYQVSAVLTADPNYVFDPSGSYTAGDEEPDEEYDVTAETEKVTFTKTTGLAKRPALKFEDVNAADAGDKVEPAVEAVRSEITVVKGESLGKYTISLGSYGSETQGVTVRDAANTLPAGYTLTPARPTEGEALADAESGGAKRVFELDLSGVDTTALTAGSAYALTLEAVGTNSYGEEVLASYTLTVKVQAAPAPVLTFEDVNAADAGDKVAAAVNAVRPTVTVKRGESLGKYTITLRDAVADAANVTVADAANTLPAGYTLTPERPTAAESVSVGGTKTFTLDLSGVDTAALELTTYTLKLSAEGDDVNNGGGKVGATYEFNIKVEPAPTPVLEFDDVKQTVTGVNTSDPDTTGPAAEDEREITAYVNAKLGKYTINLGVQDGPVKDIKFTETLTSNFTGVYGVSPDCETLANVTLTDGNRQTFELDLTGMSTKTAGTYTLTLTAEGVDLNGETVTASYTLTITLKSSGGGGGGGGSSSGTTTSCPAQVTYLVGLYGTTTDATMEMISGGKGTVTAVPSVTALDGFKFLGWSLSAPSGELSQDAVRALVDPTSLSITGDTVFYAVYQPLYQLDRPFHKHYVIGYPNGNFGPADNITRGSVATIIARAVLVNFVEGADYGNPGGYTDVEGNWAASAIAYCTKYGVFNGYEDGTFRPDQSITRQELAVVMARLSGVQSGAAPFSDMDEAGEWAKDGIYTAYAKGWVNGYTDGTFKPVDPIRRDETVKIFNAYLYRGVDEEGLSGLTEYVHTGVASNNTENGATEYMVWPDVTRDQWAYYEIIEAANDHEYTQDASLPEGYTVPEHWDKCWIDEKWSYYDDLTDGGTDTVSLVPAGMLVWNAD